MEETPQSNKKYKPCCDRRCCLYECKTREARGCYCLCRLLDDEQDMVGMPEGTVHRIEGAIVYRPIPEKILNDLQEKEILRELESLLERIKRYKIGNHEEPT